MTTCQGCPFMGCHDCTHQGGQVTASAPTELTGLAIRAASVNVQRRTITGTLVPAGELVGNTSAGPTRFLVGSLTWTDPKRVKLLREHQHADSLGHFTELAWTPDGALVGTAYLPPSDDPAEEASRKRALADAASGVRDGLSVGADQLLAEFIDQVLTVRGGLLRESSLVSVPAFDGSRVSAVVASTHRKEGTPVFTDDELAQLRAAGIDPSDQARAQGYLAGLTASAPQRPAQGPTPPTQVTAAELLDELRTVLAEGQFTVSAPPPATHQGGQVQAGQGQGMTLAEFTEALAGGYATGSMPTEVRAALTDVVPANSPAAFRPQYLDELWDGTDYQRKFIERATVQRPLGKGMKLIGHRWTSKPKVGDYAGNKTAVPSGPVTMEDIEVTVQRLAGAHDVDRAYIDLGSPEWLAAYFEAQTEDYRVQTDTKAIQVAYAGATALTDTDASPATFSTLLGGVVEAVVELAEIGEGVEYVAMAPGLVRELLNITAMDAPAFFGGNFQLSMEGDGAMGGTSWFTHPGLTGTQFLVGQRRAVRYHEHTPPIRVQAVNVANGGIDLGVFGYWAAYVRNANQLRKGTVGA